MWFFETNNVTVFQLFLQYLMNSEYLYKLYFSVKVKHQTIWILHISIKHFRWFCLRIWFLAHKAYYFSYIFRHYLEKKKYQQYKGCLFNMVTRECFNHFTGHNVAELAFSSLQSCFLKDETRQKWLQLYSNKIWQKTCNVHTYSSDKNWKP